MQVGACWAITGAPPTEVTGLAAKTYTLTVAASATDEASNAMESSSVSAFSTRRKVIHRFNRIETSALSGHTSSTGGNYSFMQAGDNGSNNELRAFLTFNLKGISENVSEITAAHFTTYVWTITNDPFTAHGDLHVEPMLFTNKTTDGWTNAPLSDQGALFTAASPPAVDDLVHFDVTSAIKDDHTNRVARSYQSQYRLRFPLFATPSDDEGDDVRVFHRPASDASASAAGVAAVTTALGRPATDFERLPVLTVEYWLKP